MCTFVQTIITMSHVSVEPQRILREMADPETQAIAKRLREKYKGKKVRPTSAYHQMYVMSASQSVGRSVSQ